MKWLTLSILLLTSSAYSGQGMGPGPGVSGKIPPTIIDFNDGGAHGFILPSSAWTIDTVSGTQNGTPNNTLCLHGAVNNGTSQLSFTAYYDGSITFDHFSPGAGATIDVDGNSTTMIVVPGSPYSTWRTSSIPVTAGSHTLTVTALSNVYIDNVMYQ